MRIRLTRVISALVSALFCTLAFSSALPDAGQALSYRGSDEPGVFLAATDRAGHHSSFEVAGSSESVTQEPLLLAVNNVHDGNNNSNNGDNGNDRGGIRS